VQASLALAGEACTPAIGNALKNPLRWFPNKTSTVIKILAAVGRAVRAFPHA